MMQTDAEAVMIDEPIRVPLLYLRSRTFVPFLGFLESSNLYKSTADRGYLLNGESLLHFRPGRRPRWISDQRCGLAGVFWIPGDPYRQFDEAFSLCSSDLC